MFRPALPIVNSTGIGKSAMLQPLVSSRIRNRAGAADIWADPYCRPELVGSAEPRSGVNGKPPWNVRIPQAANHENAFAQPTNGWQSFFPLPNGN